MNKLEILKKKSWRSGELESNRKMKTEGLTSKLLELLEVDKSDENLAEIINTKIQLNFEIEKDERVTGNRGPELIGYN